MCTSQHKMTIGTAADILTGLATIRAM